MERVVITGMGTVNPLGLTVEESWKNVVNGISGVGPITLFDSAALNVHFAAEVKNFQPEDYMDPKEARRRDRFEQLGVAAAKQALTSSGLEITEANTGRIGVLVSSAIGGIKSLQDAVITNYTEGPRRVSPFLIPMLMPNGAAGMIAIDHQIKGPCFSVASACASGADGIGMAFSMLKAGALDVALAGGSESTVVSVAVAAFDRVGAMSHHNDDYSDTPAPFDKNRDGLVMGEGAAVLVLVVEGQLRAQEVDIPGLLDVQFALLILAQNGSVLNLDQAFLRRLLEDLQGVLRSLLILESRHDYFNRCVAHVCFSLVWNS